MNITNMHSVCKWLQDIYDYILKLLGQYTLATNLDNITWTRIDMYISDNIYWMKNRQMYIKHYK